MSLPTPPNQPEQTPEFQTSRTETTRSAPSPDDGSHLDAIQMPDLDSDYVDPDAPINLDDLDDPRLNPEPEQITRDAFWLVFKTAFDLPGQMMRDFKPLGIAPDEEAGARAASDSVYALLEIYYPAALMPQSETLAHLFVAGPFIAGKVMVVRQIMMARRAPPPRPVAPAAEAAPEQKPSSDPSAFLDSEQVAA